MTEPDWKYVPLIDIDDVERIATTIHEMLTHKLLEVSELKADQEGVFIGWCYKMKLEMSVHDSCESLLTATNAYRGTAYNAANEITKNYKDILWMMEISIKDV